MGVQPVLALVVLLLMAVPRAYAQGTCKIKAQAAHGDDALPVSFIEIKDNQRLITSSVIADNPMKCVLISPDCVQIGTMREVLTDTSDNFAQGLTQLVSKTPINGFLACVSSGAISVDLTTDAVQIPFTLMGTSLTSLDENYEFGTAPVDFSTGVDSVVLFFARGKGTYTKVGEGELGPRVLEMEFTYEEQCFQGLGPYAVYDPNSYGFDEVDTLGINSYSSFILSNEATCDNHKVYGFEYYGCGTESVEVGIWRYNSLDGQFEIVGAPVTITPAAADSTERQYICVPAPIPIQRGDTVGILTPAANTGHTICNAHSYMSAEENPCGGVTSALYTSLVFSFNNRDLTDYAVADLDIGEPSSGDASIVSFRAVGVAPVTYNQRHTCICSTDDHCNQVDKNMECSGSVCACKSGYTYSSTGDVCFLKASISQGELSSEGTVNGLEQGVEGAFDSNVDGSIVTGTCAKTTRQQDPWVKFELDAEYAICSIKLTAVEPVDDRLCFYDSGGNEIFTQTDQVNTDDIANIAKYTLKGPVPYRISNDDDGLGDSFVLWSLTGGTKDVLVEVAGTVGSTVKSSFRLDYSGFLYFGEKCIQVDGTTANLVSDSTTCTPFYFFPMGDQASIISSLEDNRSFNWGSLTNGATTIVGSASSTVHLYVGDDVQNPATAALDSGSPFTIQPSTTPSKCFEAVDVGAMAIIDKTGSSCSEFTFKFLNDIAKYQYVDVSATGSATITPNPELTTRPCVKPNSEGVVITDMSDINNIVIDPVVLEQQGAPFLTSLHILNLNDDTNTDMSVQMSELVHPNLKVYVSNECSGVGFPSDMTECTSLDGALTPGVPVTLECDTCVPGRCVIVQVEGVDEVLHLCNADVLGYSTNICVDNTTCEDFHEDAHDSRAYCDVANNICVCKDGFNMVYLRDHTWVCMDVDECAAGLDNCASDDEPAIGKVNGTCVNEPGGFRCDCPDGFEIVDEDIGCEDIDECMSLNAGCAHTCTNMQVDDVDGLKYNCSCHNGYTRSDNEHDCNDNDECTIDPTLCKDDGRHSCRNNHGSYECVCDVGYENSNPTSDPTSACENINECIDTSGPAENGGCEHDCADKTPHLNGGLRYECSCDEGYELEKNMMSCADINQCLTANKCTEGSTNPPSSWPENYDTQGTCDNLIGPELYDCSCPNGFLWNETSKACEDINECETGDNHCDVGCINTPGSYTCPCPSGFELAFDGKDCSDIDECDLSPDPCQDIDDTPCGVAKGVCKNTYGDYECVCGAGFKNSASNPDVCEDINECDYENGDCTHHCTNNHYDCDTVKRTCSCDVGYEIANDMQSCKDIDECIPHTCPEAPPGDLYQHTGDCDNTIGSYNCICNEGFHLNDDGICEDIDECATRRHFCEHTCENVPGNYTCTCRPGYFSGTDGNSCHNIHNCDTDNECSQECDDTDGSYKCYCRPGNYLDNDGYTCYDVNECDQGMARCSQGCTNSDGSYHCTCDSGYTLDDSWKCENINECAPGQQGANDCAGDPNASCQDTTGSYKCVCNAGYEMGISGRCQDVDECLDDNGGCAETCTNTAGSFSCSCPPGFRRSINGRDCLDINECQVQGQVCPSSRCINTPGSFVCCDTVNGAGTQLDDCLPDTAFTLSSCKISEPWSPVYNSINSPLTGIVIAQIEADLTSDLVAGAQATVTDLYQCPNGGTGFSAAVVLPPGSDATDVTNAAAAINGAFAGGIYDPPQFANGVDISDRCGFFESINPCDNGDCQLGANGPSCVCNAGWGGARCDESTGLSPPVIAAIAAPLGLLALIAAIAAFCILSRRPSPRPSPPLYGVFEYEEKEPAYSPYAVNPPYGNPAMFAPSRQYTQFPYGNGNSTGSYYY